MVPSKRKFALVVGAALLAWSADAGARTLVAPLAFTMTPSWWAKPEVADAPELDSLLLDPLHLEAIDFEPHENEPPEIALPCGLFLDHAPRLTLFDDPAWWEPPAATFVSAWHTVARGEIETYDQIPRRWDRPSDYGAYTYPVATFPGWPAIASGYDLDLPDEAQRRNGTRYVGHGGVDLPQALGTKISMIALEHQVGDPKVVHVGTLFGNSVVTLHGVREGGEQAHYLLVFGHLDRAAPGLEPGQRIKTGDLVGFVGESESPGLVHLHLEARRIRDGIDPATVTGNRVLARDATVVSDPRNVLPLRPLERAPSCKERRRAERRAAVWSDLRLSLD